MKKILIFLTIVLSIISTLSLNLDAEIYNDKDLYTLGKGINILEASYINKENIINSNLIFKEGWLVDFVNNNTTKVVNNSNISTFDHAEDYGSYANMIGFDASFGRTGSAIIKGLIGKFAMFFSSSYIRQAENSSYSLFFNKYNKITRYYKYLPNLDQNKNLYDSGLSPAFIDDLNALYYSENENKFFSFFEKYGTHILLEGVYGGVLDIHYSVLSDDSNLTRKLKNDAVSNTQLGLLGKEISGGTENKMSFILENNKTLSSTNHLYKFKSFGGKSYDFNDLSKFYQNFNNWSSSVENYPELIDTTKNGLVPIYEFIPNLSIDRENFREKLKNYMYRYFLGSDIFVYTGDNKGKALIRENSVTIYDYNYYSKNKSDLVITKNILPRSIKSYKNSGFSKVNVRIKFEVKKIYDGYQYVALFKNPKLDYSSETPFAEKYQDFNVPYDRYSNREIVFYDLDIDNFLDGHFSIGYTAGGSKSDDWANKNLYVSMELLK